MRVSIMSSNTDHNVLRLRVRQLVDSYPEPSVLEDCDCTSYSHLILSIILLSLGTYITIPTFLSSPHHILNSLGQMWLIGPLCICCGIMVALKSVLYLRKKSVLRMILRQRALLLGIQELAEEQRFGEASSTACTAGSTTTLPPPYELIQERLPTYAEAVKSQPPPTVQNELLEDEIPKGAS
ncbi:uncharacterized protein [Halyomorpha halys]|uniref:uncharacterized protein n=2 Tax=Halyomorpha halys TaxID=286706 RepID=UPI0006D4DDCB|nr:uncharacterized protein LOC106691812 isoform X2 [Halyomorpha halys]